MAKTGKGKAVAGPSKSRKTAAGQSSSRRAEEEEDERVVYTVPRRDMPWTEGPLTKIHYPFQAGHFREKMVNQKEFKNAFLFERDVNELQFRAFDIVQKFEALGWLAALHVYDGEVNKIYTEALMDWVGTLEVIDLGKPTMALTGLVGDVRVEMNKNTLKEIADFDNLQMRGSNKCLYPSASQLYEQPDHHPRWNTMLAELFLDGDWRSMRRDKMLMPARLLLLLVQQNILPRRSDRGYLRHPDVQIVHALLTGAPKISFCHLVMMNIWNARIWKDKKNIPHVRLITALLKRGGVDLSEQVPLIKQMPSFILQTLYKFEWSYVETPRYHKLKNAGRKWRALKLDAPPLLEGQEDEDGSDDLVMGQSDGDDAEMVDGGGAGPSMPMFGGMPDYYSALPAYQGMDQFVEQSRPLAWVTWNSYQQAMFDHATRNAEQQRYDSRLTYNRQEEWNRAHAYNQQVEVNLRWQDEQLRRRRESWRHAEEWVEHLPVMDYSSLPPYDGTSEHPAPVHHSPWIDPVQHQQHQQQQDGGNASDPFSFSGMLDTMRGIFGDPQNPYY